MRRQHKVTQRQADPSHGFHFDWILTIAFLLMVASGRTAGAADATLSWSANTESDLAGYRVHYGTSSGSYPNMISVGNVTTYTVTGLGPGTYYFVLTAYSTAGAESGFSNEVGKTVPDTQPPAISAVTVGSLTSAQATVSWSTSEPATSLVEYGTGTTYGLQTTENPALAGQHQHRLTGLVASTTYHFRVLSRDDAGNLAASGDRTFTTLAAPDTTAPSISTVAAGSVTSSGATITWTTNEPATTQVQYGPTSAYGSTTTVNSTLVTAHSQALTGLTAATLYHYRVLSRDAAGNLATSPDFSFNTPAAPDTTAPSISAVAAGSVTSSGATITWTTNEPATAQVTYGTTTTYGSSTPVRSTLVTAHSQQMTGLAAATVYHFRVISRDAAGNQALSGDFSVTTLAAQPPPSTDTTPPIISRVSARATNATSAVVTWRTNERATSVVEYGPTSAYGSSSAPDASLVQLHRQTLTGLRPATTYHFRVHGKDAAGNLTVSRDQTFKTPRLRRSR